MAQYAYFDSTQPVPQPVLGWYDTVAIDYPNLPAFTNLLALTSQQWADRLSASWSVSGGTLVATVPPPLTLAQQAAQASISGLTIASTGPTLTMAAAKFPTDTATQSVLNTVVNGLNTNGTFPEGAATFPMVDAATPPVWHPLTIPQYKAISTAIFNYVSANDLIAAGNPLGATALPIPSVTISV